MFCVAEGESTFSCSSIVRSSLHVREAPQAQDILCEAGYRIAESMEERLEFLRLRMRVRKTLPPEIGLFLGYPPEDVRGFITWRGTGLCLQRILEGLHERG